MYKSTDTKGFLLLAADAETHQRNRHVDTEMLTRMLDPDGVHVGTVMVLHEHVGGRPVEPHYRTQWLMKFAGKEQPQEAWLDVNIALFEALTQDIKDEETKHD